MSWQDYVDKQLLASGFVNHAAIIGSDGALWAKSASFDVSITRTLCHFIFVSFRFLHFDSSFVSFYGILILLSLCVHNAPKNVCDRRDCFPCRFLFSLVMSFSLSFKTTDWGTRHAAIYGHEFGRIFKYGVALSLSLAVVIVSIDLQIQRLISRCEIPGVTRLVLPLPQLCHSSCV